MNIHRRAKCGCKIAINHFKNVCPGAKFSIHVLEKLPGDGYKNGSRDKDMYLRRLKREDFWMKKLRTIYPYGLNEKSKDMNKNTLHWPVGKLFPPIARHSQREPGIRNRKKVPAQNPLKNFLNFEQHLITIPVLNRTNECRRLLDSFKIKDIRYLVTDSKRILADDYSESRKRWCNLISDIFVTKTFKDEKVEKKKRKRPKYMFFVNFVNKGFDYIQLSSILHEPLVVESLPDNLKNDDVPSIVYRLSNTV